MTLLIISRIIAYVAVGFLAGFSAVFVFNHIPVKWLCDYDQEPGEEIWGKRINEYPWKFVFSFFFSGAVFLIWEMETVYRIAAVPALWLLLLIGLADRKFMIIPDQFVIGLAVVSIGFIPYRTGLMSALYGALIGGGSLLIIGSIGRWISKKDTMGFGDVKLMAVIGLISGIKGIVIILILTFFSAGAVMGFGLLSGRLKREDEQPLGLYIAAATAAFILFRPWLMLLADCYLSASFF